MPIYCALNTKAQGLSTFEFGGEWGGALGGGMVRVEEASAMSCHPPGVLLGGCKPRGGGSP